MNAPEIDRAFPRIPRDQWLAHPHFPSQVLLLGSHENFRRLNRHLIDEAEQPGSSLDPLRQLYTRWISAMRSHEGYEERKLYPYLARRWGVSFDAATAGHRALHDADHVVLDAFVAASRDATAAARAAVVAALTHHDLVLGAHLELEEDLVIPLLLELSPAEFENYTRSSIASLLRAG